MRVTPSGRFSFSRKHSQWFLGWMNSSSSHRSPDGVIEATVSGDSSSALVAGKDMYVARIDCSWVLISSLDILSSTDVIGGARSQSPACGCLTASSLALSSLVDAFDKSWSAICLTMMSSQLHCFPWYWRSGGVWLVIDFHASFILIIIIIIIIVAKGMSIDKARHKICNFT